MGYWICEVYGSTVQSGVSTNVDNQRLTSDSCLKGKGLQILQTSKRCTETSHNESKILSIQACKHIHFL